MRPEAAAGLARALTRSQQAQLFADRAALIHSAGQAVPASGPGTFAAMYGRYQALAGQVLATSDANLFLIIAVVTGSAALLALFMRSQPVALSPAGRVRDPPGRIARKLRRRTC